MFLVGFDFSHHIRRMQVNANGWNFPHDPHDWVAKENDIKQSIKAQERPDLRKENRQVANLGQLVRAQPVFLFWSSWDPNCASIEEAANLSEKNLLAVWSHLQCPINLISKENTTFNLMLSLCISWQSILPPHSTQITKESRDHVPFQWQI